MSWSTGTAVVLLCICLLLVYLLHGYRTELQDVRTQLALTQGDLKIVEGQLAATKAAHEAKQQAQEKANNELQERIKLLENIPGSWGDNPLPDECVRVWKYDPAAAVGPDTATGGDDAGN